MKGEWVPTNMTGVFKDGTRWVFVSRGKATNGSVMGRVVRFSKDEPALGSSYLEPDTEHATLRAAAVDVMRQLGALEGLDPLRC